MSRDDFYSYLTQLDPQLVRIGTLAAYECWLDSAQDVPSVVWLWSDLGMAAFSAAVEAFLADEDVD